MNLVYLANIRIPTEKAHGLQISKMCEALADVGVDVTLCVSDRKTFDDDPFGYYSVKRNFKIEKLHSLDFVDWGPLGFLLYTFSFALSFLRGRYRHNADIVFVRDPYLAAILSFFDIPYVWEIHQYFGGYKGKRGFKHARAVVYISRGLQETYKEHGLIHPQGEVLPDGVDDAQFSVDESKEESRKRLGLPADLPLILYTGHLYSWKGVDTLAESARYLEDAFIIFVGGTDQDIKVFRGKYESISQVRIMGRYPYEEMKYFANAADVLVIPNTSREKISREHTSPLKLFNYMASGKPIVASDLPSIREIIDEEHAYFAESDNAQSFAAQIKYVLSHYSDAEQRGRSAREEAKKYTWTKRAMEILDILKT